MAAVLLIAGRWLGPRPGAVRRAFVATLAVAILATVGSLLPAAGRAVSTRRAVA